MPEIGDFVRKFFVLVGFLQLSTFLIFLSNSEKIKGNKSPVVSNIFFQIVAIVVFLDWDIINWERRKLQDQGSISFFSIQPQNHFAIVGNDQILKTGP